MLFIYVTSMSITAPGLPMSVITVLLCIGGGEGGGWLLCSLSVSLFSLTLAQEHKLNTTVLTSFHFLMNQEKLSLSSRLLNDLVLLTQRGYIMGP